MMKKTAMILAAALLAAVFCGFRPIAGERALAAPGDSGITGIALTPGAAISPAFSAEITAYTVTLYDTVDSVTITPQPAPGAAYTINGQSMADITVTLAAPAQTATVTVEATAADGVTKTAYTLTVTRAAPVSLDLTSLSYSLGVRMNPMFSPALTSYQALVPYSMGSVTLTVTKAAAAATVTINGVPGLSRSVAVGPGASLAVPITVSSPSTTDKTKTYTVYLKRGTTLSGLTAVPKVGSVYELSPGGSNRLTLKYKMNGPGAVKVEVQRGKKWTQVMTRAEPAVGEKTWGWDGRVGGTALPAGSYRVRVTPSAFGMTSTGQTIMVRIVRAPSLTWASVPSPFHAQSALCKFKLSVPSNAQVRVFTAAGKLAAEAGAYTNLAPGVYKTVMWDGTATAGNAAGIASGAPVPAGTYTVRITAGSKTFSRTIKIIG